MSRIPFELQQKYEESIVWVKQANRANLDCIVLNVQNTFMHAILENFISMIHSIKKVHKVWLLYQRARLNVKGCAWPPLHSPPKLFALTVSISLACKVIVSFNFQVILARLNSLVSSTAHVWLCCQKHKLLKVAYWGQ